MLNYLRRISKQTIFSFLAVLPAMLLGAAGTVHAQCSNPANAIVAENCLPGNPQSEWDIQNGDAGDPTIQGFATDISVNQGGTIYFKIKTDASAYTINIYRMGYYGGMGARKVATITPSVPLPQTQPACATDASVGLEDCGNWAVSASWTVPANATSGIYFAHLIRTDTGGDSHIVFIVRNDSSHSNILFQTNDSTWQAYNYYGGGSLYGPNSPTWDLSNRSYKVSYNRPVMTRGFANESATWVFGSNYPMVRWLEANGYDVTYFTDVDATRSGSLILNHKIYMADGHDEYISSPQRTNIKAARDAGVNLAFFTGNGMFWKTRWENSIDGSNTAYRTLVCYKETLAFAKIDPTSTWTGTWRDPSFSPPSDGGQPENALQGTIFMVNGPGADNNGLSIEVPAADGKMRFWRNTAVASLAANQTYTLPQGTLGYEWDEDIDNGFRPAGLFDLSTATYSLDTDLLLDYGGVYGAGAATHHMTMYRAPSGALVFGAGTVQWSWGLDSNHDNSFGFDTPDPDPNMQQATVNLFADMGVQPATLQPGLSAATASTDTTPPVSTITSPAANATVSSGTGVTITGTATDTGGGVVAGVEVSGDGGATWHPATGRGSWSYTWTPSVVGSATIMSRAVDDSGNLEKPSGGVTVNVQPQTCPCSIWNSSSSPKLPDSGDGNSVEVGVKFTADSDGSVTGIRFYKSTANTGTHIGHLWTSTGTLLGTATFTSESGSGWQQVNFSSPIPVTANTTYVASYLAPKGHYSADAEYFLQSGYNNPPLHALENGVDGDNGVYAYTTTGGFPNQSYLSTNYWVDVVYTSSNTYSISGMITGTGGGGATVTLSGSASLTTTSSASGSYSFDGLVNGTYTVSVSNPGVTFTPPSQTVTIDSTAVPNVNFTAAVTNPLSITGTISGGAGAAVYLSGAATAQITADASGNYSFSGLMGGSYTVTPVLPGYMFAPYSQSVNLSATNATGVNFQGQVCDCVSIWNSSSAPSLVDSNDGTPVEVGVKFRADSAGYITGVRFYKAATNVGTHVAHLWTSTGALLATATFTNETASGWQQVNFSEPVAVSAGTTYIVSYFAPSGHYSADTNYFAASGVDNPPLHALAEGVDGSNGVYIYTSSGGVFPVNSYDSTNYWVDVVYMGYQSYGISGMISGGAGATVTLSGLTTVVTTADSSGNYSFSGLSAGTYTVTPSESGYIMIPGSQTVTVSNASVTGVNFTVPSICPCDTIWQPSTVPGVVDQGDAHAIELGLRFRADNDGYVVGVRFYKSAANTGAHIGNLWTSAQSGTGTLLATAPFTNESATGWQQVTFANPVPVSANTTYVASYFAPVGHYSATSGAFASAGVDSPPLHALANGVDGLNGIYSYSSISTYPSSSYNSANYWVDVIYAPATTFTLAGSITGTGASGTQVTLAGPVSQTVTTGTAGTYTFSGLPDGTYTVTPSNGGIAFSPASQTVVINGAHQLAVNFSSSLPYSISGTITGGGDDTVALSGSATATTTADASGNYTFPQVANGTYTVTPGATGFTVNPTSQSVTVNGAAVTGVNFTATAMTFSISGTVTGGAGATVSLSGSATATTTADASGNYSFGGLVDGTYTVTPTAPNLIFNPGTQLLVVYGANITGANFAVLNNCPCDTIWQPSAAPGTPDVDDTNSVELGVKFRVDADGYVSGVRFYKSFSNQGTHQGNLWTSTGTLLARATFTSEGTTGWQQVIFSQPVPVQANTTYVASYFAPDGHYSADSGFFTSQGVDAPPLHALQNGVDGPNGLYGYSTTSAFPTSSYNAANYWVDVIYSPATTYTVAGTINGAGGPGATVNLSGAATATVTADASGNFSFNGLPNGTYTMAPSLSGYSYSPAVTTVTINNAHVLNVAISSSQLSSISGTISGAGGAGATVNLSGASAGTVTANASGVYTFTGLANGNYTVTPTNSGYVMTPSSQPVTLNGANVTANFTSQPKTYTLSGTISGAGGSGATVTLSGTSSATVTASSTGAYSFTVTNGSYTVTPAKTGYAFTPSNRAVTINGANATASFTSAQTYSISGTITGLGVSGVTVTLSGGATATTVTNSSGAFTFSGLASGTYKVTPSKSGTIFTPSNKSVTIKTSNVTGVSFLAL